MFLDVWRGLGREGWRGFGGEKVTLNQWPRRRSSCSPPSARAVVALARAEDDEQRKREIVHGVHVDASVGLDARPHVLLIHVPRAHREERVRQAPGRALVQDAAPEAPDEADAPSASAVFDHRTLRHAATRQMRLWRCCAQPKLSLEPKKVRELFFFEVNTDCQRSRLYGM